MRDLLLHVINLVILLSIVSGHRHEFPTLTRTRLSTVLQYLHRMTWPYLQFCKYMSTELLQIYVLVYNLQIKEAEIVQFIIKHSVIRMQKDTPPCIHF